MGYYGTAMVYGTAVYYRGVAMAVGLPWDTVARPWLYGTAMGP